MLLGESTSTAAAQQSMLYPRHVRRAADEAARKTWSICRTACFDIISGQQQYDMPARPFRLNSVCVNDGFGNIWPLDAITPDQADEMYYNWHSQNTPAIYQGIPKYYLPQGLTSYFLFPTPNYSVQEGLLVDGYYGVDKWWDMSTESLLPEGYDECVLKGTAYRRCEEMMRLDPTYAQMLPIYKADYEALLRRMYRESLGHNAARRGGSIPSGGKRLSAWSFGWGWFG